MQYTAIILVSISWLGTDLSGIRIIADSNINERGSDFASIIILRNIAFLIFYFLLCPILFGKFSLSIFLYGIGMVNIPSFYFFGERNSFSKFIISEIAQKITLALVLFYSTLNEITFLKVFTLISLVLCINSGILIAFIVNKEKLIITLIKKNLSIAKDKYFKTGIFYILIQITQQLTYTLPVILFQRAGLYSIATELTNLERVIRIIRGLVGQSIKVMLGKVKDYSLEIKFLRYFIGFNMVIIVLCFLLDDRLMFVPDYLKFDLFNLGLFLITIPIASISTFLLGTKLREGSFSKNDIYQQIIRLIACLLGFVLLSSLLGSFYGTISLIILLEIWLLKILLSIQDQ
tara:strand:- start:286 stop:1326 length:1041 start_codon:yes stop_codon:yes gene_type:complete